MYLKHVQSGILLLATSLAIPGNSSQVMGQQPVKNLGVEELDLTREQWAKDAELKFFVQPGNPTEALQYYTRIGVVLDFDFLSSNLDTFLEYLGFATTSGTTRRGLQASDLEKIDSFNLMPKSVSEFQSLADEVADPVGFRATLQLSDFSDGKVLVSRFFAPKIATYFNPAPNADAPIERDDIIPGWRKLVRLTSRKGSTADNAGVRHVYLLFNVKNANPDVNPYAGNESKNNQVIIVPKEATTGDNCYFAVYKSETDGYKIGQFLAADFDLPGHTGLPDGKYYVPRSCAECHGHSGNLGSVDLKGEPVTASGQPTNDFSTGVYRYAKPNYLDTDQWYDWMEFDYRGVTTSFNDVIFDGGKDHGSQAYERALGVVRRLNSAIRDETFRAEKKTGVKSYQTQAVEKWIGLHASNVHRKPYSVRSFGTEDWDATSPDEMRLVRLLNNHCFRCHSSLRYNVFDKAAVRSRSELIKLFLTLPVSSNGQRLPGFFMPQGRVLEAVERDEIRDLIDTVFP